MSLAAPAPVAPQWRQEAGHLGRSGAILAFNQLLQIAIPFVTTTMTGRLGVDALATGGMVGSIGLLFFITSLGVLQGSLPQVGVAIGASDRTGAVRAIRTSLAVAFAIGLGTTATMAAVPWCLARVGQDPAVVDLAQRFILALLPGYLPSILAIALRFALIAANDLRWLNPIMIAGTAFNVVCNLLLARGTFGIDGLPAVGATISLTNWLILGCLVVAVSRSQRIPFGLLSRTAGFATRDMLARGIPVGAIFFTEALLFAGSSVLMGYVGKVGLAAHGVALLWLNVALMIPIGFSQAAMARIAMLAGQRRFDTIRHAAIMALLSVVTASAVMGVLLVAASDELMHLAMWSRSAASEAVVDTGRGYFRFCAITQLLSGLVIVMASILRGIGDDSAVLWLVMLGYWGVGLGGCTLLAFAFGLGGAGIWMGIVLAFAFAVVLLTVRLRRALAQLST